MRILGTLLVFCTVGLLPECLPAQSSTARPNTIRVDIGGLRNDKGQVFCALYSSFHFLGGQLKLKITVAYL